MKKILVDVDTGVDDSIALLYALFHPEVEIVGITTGCGNVDAFQAAQNTLRILDLANAVDIPVVIGANQPLDGRQEKGCPLIHGENGIGNVKLAPTKRKLLDDITAEDFIYKMALSFKQELTIVTLGRMTNLALTLEKHPDIMGLGACVVAMGGTLNVPGNVSPVVEANFGGDPLACDRVFCSGLDILVVGLDVTTRTVLRKSDVEQAGKYCSPRCRAAFDYIEQALVHYMEGCRIQNHYIDSCPLHDPLAMIAAVKPSLFVTQKRKARIECQGTYCKGMVVTDRRENTIDANYVEFAVDVDTEKALQELFSAFWN